MNNSIITVNKDICEYHGIASPAPHVYKTILDIAYMAGICLGGQTFHFIGETYGLRFSLGFALFTTFLGSSLGLACTNIWSVSFSSGELSSLLYILFPRFYMVTRFITGFGSMACYLMAWLLVLDVIKKDSLIGCGYVTYFTLVANFLSIAFALGAATSK